MIVIIHIGRGIGFFAVVFWGADENLCELHEKGQFGPNDKEYVRKDGVAYPVAGILGFNLTIQRCIFGDIKENNVVTSECNVFIRDMRKYLEKREITKMLNGIHEAGSRAALIVRNMLNSSKSF